MAALSSVRKTASLLLRNASRSSRRQPDIYNCRKRCISSSTLLRADVKSPQPAYTAAFESHTELFSERHVGPSHEDVTQMLKTLSSPPSDLDDFIRQTLP